MSPPSNGFGSRVYFPGSLWEVSLPIFNSHQYKTYASMNVRELSMLF